jgi:hypothetical protein
VLSLVPTSLGKKGGKRAALLSNIAQRVPWQGVRRLYDPQAELVLWLHHRYPHSLATWTLRGDTVLKDFALINAVVERELPFRLVTGPEIGTVVNSRIVYSVDAYNPARVRNYSASLMAALRQLEAQGNVLYPSADEAEWWENKVFMHRRFDELGINTPPTTIVGRETDVDEESLEYPLIAKEPHSHGSLGVHKVGDAGELRALRGRLAARSSAARSCTTTSGSATPRSGRRPRRATAAPSTSAPSRSAGADASSTRSRRRGCAVARSTSAGMATTWTRSRTSWRSVPHTPRIPRRLRPSPTGPTRSSRRS